MVDELDFDPDDLLYISAKDGTGVEEVFASIIERVPPPSPPATDPNVLKCFLFDARFVPERGGVACLIKVMSGVLDIESVRQIMSYHMRKRYEVYQIGIV